MAKKKIGKKGWAWTKVILENGTKIYVENSYDEIKRQMECKKGSIELKIANCDNGRITIRKKHIVSYAQI